MIALLSVMAHCILSLWTSGVDGKVRNTNDPERATIGSTPANWQAEIYEARYQGLMYAGMSEFNWILDIRLENRDAETWSVGNLITFYHVMTTCRAVTTLERYIPGTHTFTLKTVEPDSIRVNFCTTYLWADVADAYVFNPRGTRLVKAVTPNAYCNPYTLLEDFALLTLATGIHPLVPLTGYMPIPGSYRKKPSWYLIKKLISVCYIATFGKDHINLMASSTVGVSNRLKDHKIKYRVYYVEWSECSKLFATICPSNEPVCSRTNMNDQRFQSKVMCFRPRKKVGALCDHDRGAPLVCNDFVYGMVIKGVQQRRCNNLVQYPVLVLDNFDYNEKLNFLIKYEGLDIKSDSMRNSMKSILRLATLVTFFHTYQHDF